MSDSTKPRVFLSYSRVNVDCAAQLHKQLTAYGATVWFDQVSLRPGEKWKPAIRRAISEARYFLVLLSSGAVNRRGFLNDEITEALDILRQYPESEIFIVPVRLDQCSPSHSSLHDLHWLDLFPSWNEGLHRLLTTFGIGVPQPDLGIFNISICASCGSSDFTFYEIRFSGIHNVGLECKACKWRYDSDLEIYQLSDDQFGEMQKQHGKMERLSSH